MKKWIFLLLGWAWAMASCTMETSDNGALDGYWQLASVDSLPDGPSVDTRDMGIFWSVQARLLRMTSGVMVLPDVFFRFDHRGDSLLLSHPVLNNRNIGDSLLEDASQLRPYGLSGLSDTLQVLQLSNSRMALKGKIVRLHFRKF